MKFQRQMLVLLCPILFTCTTSGMMRRFGATAARLAAARFTGTKPANTETPPNYNPQECDWNFSPIAPKLPTPQQVQPIRPNFPEQHILRPLNIKADGVVFAGRDIRKGEILAVFTLAIPLQKSATPSKEPSSTQPGSNAILQQQPGPNGKLCLVLMATTDIPAGEAVIVNTEQMLWVQLDPEQIRGYGFDNFIDDAWRSTVCIAFFLGGFIFVSHWVDEAVEYCRQAHFPMPLYN